MLILKKTSWASEKEVKFLGHGIGLQIDELPVIAEKFTEPIREEDGVCRGAKKGISVIGMVELNAFIVTPHGGNASLGIILGISVF